MTPSKPGDPSQGKPAADEQTELEATEAKQAAATETAAETPEGEPEEKAKPRRRTRAKKAEGTAAEVTGEQKDAAEAAVHEGSAEPVADRDSDAGSGDDDDAAAPEQAPAPGRRRRRGAAAEEQAPAPAPARRAKRPAGERVLVRATARYVRTSPRKARLVCDHIRGKSVQEARAILAHTPRAVARDWSKLLESAVANAEHNHELVGDELRIHSVTADEGPTLKRFRPRAMGRATRIRKRTSHLTITLTPKG
jgi:ribosomal protein L22